MHALISLHVRLDFVWEALVAQALAKHSIRTPDMHAWHSLSPLRVRVDVWQRGSMC